MNNSKVENLKELCKRTGELVDYASCMQMATGYKLRDKFNYIGLLYILGEARRELEQIENRAN